MTIHINGLKDRLTEKEEELHDMDNLNQTLILREHMSNSELQAARKELINVRFLYLRVFRICEGVFRCNVIKCFLFFFSHEGFAASFGFK